IPGEAGEHSPQDKEADMPKPKSEYNAVLVEAYDNTGGEFSREPIRLRPVKDQIYSPKLHVSCSRPDRKSSGSLFLLECRRVTPQDRDEYLYTPPHWGLRAVSEADAARFLKGEPVWVDGKQFTRPSAPALT